MKVADLAKEFNTTVDDILALLKTLKLKAKDGEQELNAVVLSVVHGELVKRRGPVKKAKPRKPKAADDPTAEKKSAKPRKKATGEGEPAKKIAKKGTKQDAPEPVVPEVKKEVPPVTAPTPAVSAPVKAVELTPRPVVTPSSSSPVTSPQNYPPRPASNYPPRPASNYPPRPASNYPPRPSSGMPPRPSSFAPRDSRPFPPRKPGEGYPPRDVHSHPVPPTVAPGMDQRKDFHEKPFRKHSNITQEPVITLKPLSKKRKRPATKEEYREEQERAFRQEKADALLQPAAHDAPVYREGPITDLEVKTPITVKDLSTRIQQKPSVVLKELMRMGMLCHINQGLDDDLVATIVKIFGFNFIKIKTQEEQLIAGHLQEQEDPSTLKPRAPVVTFMGHVDHGKTSLLDSIRKSNVIDTEHGGITQHMGAYSVVINKGRITFLDTPGHEAFTAMRARGAHITDIVVLVVAADEGIMPQTKEAIDHARAANVPIVVALNKIDKSTVDIDRVKKQLAELDLLAEDWGGKTVVTGVSALTGKGVDTLLELILLEAEMLELRANPDKRASGIVVEAHLSQGKGAVVTLIVQSGSLHEGDIVVAGPHYGKVKAMFDDRGKRLADAGPSMPVEILGLPEVPDAGEVFYVVADDKQAREITSKRHEEIKNKRLHAVHKISLEDLYANMQPGQAKELNVVLKADVQGSLEALRDSLTKIPSEKAKIKFIHAGVGEVTASDVLLAVASKAVIIAFQVGISVRAKEELEDEPVDVRQYRIIYDAVEDVRKALEGMLEAKQKKRTTARVEVRQVFKLSKHGIVAGCFVQKGRAKRKDLVDVVRNGEVVFSGKISSLKRFKDDVKEVTEDMECGITIDGFDTYEVGDIIEIYEIESIAQRL